MQLIAVSRPQLDAAHEQMAAWCQTMIDKMRADVTVESEVLERARQSKWAIEPHKRRLRQLERRREFYEKIHAAVLEGYVIVPNFPMDLFAIRTDATTPRHQSRAYHGWRAFREPSRSLAAGEGEYKNPDVGYTTDESKDEAGKAVVLSETVDEFDPIEFPFDLAKPQLMEAVEVATRQRIFDELGVGRNEQRGDPVILGRILNPRRGRSPITFFIGWQFDPSSL